MLSRYEYLYTKKKDKSLSDKLFEFANGRIWDERKKQFYTNDTYKQYTNYINLSPLEKTKIEESWNNYYKKCRESEYGKLFFSMKDAFKRHDQKLIKEIVEKSKAMTTPYTPQPSSIDPNELIMKMNTYFTLRYESKILTDLVEEYSDIYEKKDERMGL